MVTCPYDWTLDWDEKKQTINQILEIVGKFNKGPCEIAIAIRPSFRDL